MRTALWETSTGALAALLNARGPLIKADIYTLTLGNGTLYRWSGADVAVIGGGHTWVLGPGIKRSAVRFTVGVEVDTMNVTLTDVATTTINGQALIPFIRAGGLLGARLQVDKAFAGPDDTGPVGALLWFAGRVADVPRIDRYQAQINVKSDLEVLDVMVPRDVYQASCLNTLYDATCGADRAAKTVTGSATSATDAQRITFSHALGQAAGYFDLGVLTMTSGANTGISRTVRLHTSGAISVQPPWPFAVASGNTFSLIPGCNKSLTDTNGCSKFHSGANVKLRFRGQPFVPTPETVL